MQQGTRTILIKFLKGHGSSLDSTNNQHLDGTWESHEKKVNEVRNTCNLKDPFLFEKKLLGIESAEKMFIRMQKVLCVIPRTKQLTRSDTGLIDLKH